MNSTHIMNFRTGRLVLKNGKLGKKILKKEILDEHFSKLLDMKKKTETELVLIKEKLDKINWEIINFNWE